MALVNDTTSYDHEGRVRFGRGRHTPKHSRRSSRHESVKSQTTISFLYNNKTTIEMKGDGGMGRKNAIRKGSAKTETLLTVTRSRIRNFPKLRFLSYIQIITIEMKGWDGREEKSSIQPCSQRPSLSPVMLFADSYFRHESFKFSQSGQYCQDQNQQRVFEDIIISTEINKKINGEIAVFDAS